MPSRSARVAVAVLMCVLIGAERRGRLAGETAIARPNVVEQRWTKAGLMMRDGLAADARHAYIIQTPRTERGVAFQRRPVAGGPSVDTAGPAAAPSGFLRLSSARRVQPSTIASRT